MRIRTTIRVRLTVWYAGLALAGGLLLVAGSLVLAIHHVDVYPRRVDALAAQLAADNSGHRRAHDSRRPSPPLPSRAELERLSTRAAIGRQIRSAAERKVRLRTRRALLLELGGLLAGFALIAVATGLVVTRRALAPVARITAAARRVGAGSLNERLRLQGPDDELKVLGDTFDEMLERVEQALERERAFIANASHELRTPLAIIRAEIDASRTSETALETATARGFEVIETAVARSERLLQSLFALARASRGDRPQTTSNLRIAFEDALHSHQRTSAELDLSVRAELEEAWILADATLLKQLVDNLLDNAVRYNRPGGELLVETFASDGRATIVVENDGAQLTEAEVAHLTQPFTRGDGARQSEPSGLGLGLALVESIARAHSGELELAARPEGGLRVVVHFPPVEPQPSLPAPASLHEGEAAGTQPLGADSP